MNRKQLGLEGEKLACRHIQSLGYQILYNNYRTRKGEIDIIACYNEILIFIEVKLRKNLKYGYPIESVNSKKVKTIKSVASEYLKLKNLNCKVRFDVIEIFLDNEDNYKINLIQNAFY